MPSFILACRQGGWASSNDPEGMPLNSQNIPTTNIPPTSKPLPEIAEMIAEGELPIPLEWEAEHLATLLDLVHDARRKRLVSFVARCIASDIRRLERQKENQSC